MKVKVTHRFRDKHTNVLYQRGQVLVISEERYDEIMKAGNFVQKIAQEGAETPEGAKATNSAIDGVNAAETVSESAETPDDGFDTMSVAELKEYADKTYKLAFKSGMKKAEIIHTLRRMEQKEMKTNG